MRPFTFLRPPAAFLLSILLVMVLVPGQVVFAQDPTPPLTPQPTQDVIGSAVEITENTVDTVANFFSRLIQPPRSDIARVLLIIGGVILLVAGWRIYEFIIVLSGILIGATFAASLFPNADTLVVVAALIIGGLAGALLGVFVYYLAVFLNGAYVGIVLTGGVARLLSLEPVSPLALIVGAIIGGLVLLALAYELLIVLSALVGAQLIVLALGLSTIWTIILTGLGIIIQLVAARAYGIDIRRRPVRRPLFYRT